MALGIGKGIAAAAGTAAALAAGYAWCIRPNNARRQAMEPFVRTPIAHRGLFSPELGVPENSLAAFRRAVDHGFGMELDVQLTSDDVLVVFHDDSLERMCGVKKNLRDCTWDQLQQLRLAGTGHRIPRFSEVLDAVAGATPMVVEVKPNGRAIEAAQAAVEALRDYQGVFCVESFNPAVVWWFRRKHPELVCGQLATNSMGNRSISWARRVICTNMLMNGLTRPDFVAYDRNCVSNLSYRACRKLFNPSLVTWTVRSQEAFDRAQAQGQAVIFDSFMPAGWEKASDADSACGPEQPQPVGRQGGASRAVPHEPKEPSGSFVRAGLSEHEAPPCRPTGCDDAAASEQLQSDQAE